MKLLPEEPTLEMIDAAERNYYAPPEEFPDDERGVRLLVRKMLVDAIAAAPEVKDERIAELEAEVARLRAAIRGKSDAYQLLTNIANGIESPADVQMAVSALRKIDEALK